MTLDFQAMPRIKRRRELDWLAERWETSLLGTATAVLVEAAAGMGKSTLISSFLEDERVREKALICCGKFEERTAAQQPFAAIIEATDTLMERILHSGEGSKWGRRIRDSLDVEMDLLKELFPSFQGIIKASRRMSGSTATLTDSEFYFDGFGNMTDKEWRFERLRLAIRALFRCLAYYSPVIFCLDDLQWVDPDSLVLIQTLILDQKQDRKFMFITTARPQPVVGGFPRENVEVLSLPGLNTTEISQWLVALLQQSPDEARPLAERLQQHTDGNAFAVVHCLRRLSDQHHFTWDKVNKCWIYDMHEISLGIKLIEKPATMVRERLLALSEDERLTLVVASSFGTSYFEITTTVHALMVLERTKQQEISKATVPQRRDSVDPFFVQNRIRETKAALGRLEEKGLVVKQQEEGHYKFCHDNIREAAYSLFPEGRARQEIHLGIGRQLRLWMDAESELGTTLSQESLVLYAVKHLNTAVDLINDPWELVDLAELNYQAAELVADKSSFFPALEYLRFGVELLGEEGWKNHYALALKLHVALSRIEYCVGHYDECLDTAGTVIKHGRFTREERLVYHTKIFCLINKSKKMEALDLVLTVLQDMGHNFPRRFLQKHVTKEYKNIALWLKGQSDEDILALPRINDDDLNESVEFMERMAELSKFGTVPAYFKLFAFRLMKLTKERGIFPLSTLAFITWAWCMVDMGNHDEGVRFGKLAMELADERRGRARDTRTKFLYWTHIFHWRHPYRDGLSPMISLLKEFWQHSAIDFIFHHSVHVPRLGLASGHDLQATLMEAEKYGEFMLDCKQEVFWRRLAPIHQAILNLLGRSPEGSRLAGDVIDEAKCRKEWSSDIFSLFVIDLMSLFLGCMFQDYEPTLECINRMEKGDIAKSFGPDYWLPLRIFYSGLALAALSKEKKFRGHKRRAQSYLNQLRVWSDQGNIACRHMCFILDAELLRSTSPKDVTGILCLYDQASEAASEVMMTQHEALSYELAARFLNDAGDSAKATEYFSFAVDTYETWGAVGKIEQLCSEFPDLLGAIATAYRSGGNSAIELRISNCSLAPD